MAAALAVANLYLLMRLWLGKDFPAIIAAVTLAVSHTFWWHASIAETYTLWTALFLAELIMLLQYTRTRKVGYLYLLGLLNGLAIAVHMLASIPLVCYAVLLVVLLARRSIRAKDVADHRRPVGPGALPYEYLIIKNMVHSGDVLGTLASAAFGDRWRADVLNTSLSWKIVKEDLLFLVLNFPTPNALLFFVGRYALYRTAQLRAFRSVIIALLVLFFVFAVRYTVSDRYAFFMPFYCRRRGRDRPGRARGSHAAAPQGGCVRDRILCSLLPVCRLCRGAGDGGADESAHRDAAGICRTATTTSTSCGRGGRGTRGAERFARRP